MRTVFPGCILPACRSNGPAGKRFDMDLSQLLKEIDPVAVQGSKDRDILGITCDSRQVRDGYVFVAVPGDQQDGWDFVHDAMERGASAIVSEKSRVAGSEPCFVQVSDARTAGARLAAAFNGCPADHLRMVGITGTNGKTTCAYMTRDILRASGLNPGLITTVVYEMGARTIPASRTTPDAPTLHALLGKMVASECDSAVMEVSSHALVQDRTYGIDYDVALFTNLTRDHLDYHHTMDAYFEAKRKLFTSLGHGGKKASAVLNIDDEWGRKLQGMQEPGVDVVTYGMTVEADVTAEDVSLEASGTSFTLRSPWGDAKIKAGLLGRFNVSNMLASTATCACLGADPESAADVLGSMRRVPGRLEEVNTGKDFKVFVDYAHTDDALDHVLTTLREITTGNLILVFGCGGDRDRSKRSEMGRIAGEKADYSIITSDNPRGEPTEQIIAEVRAGFGLQASYEMIENRRDAIKRALGMAGQGDVVLVAGKGHECFQEFAKRTVPFDDREEVTKGLEDL